MVVFLFRILHSSLRNMPFRTSIPALLSCETYLTPMRKAILRNSIHA